MKRILFFHPDLRGGGAEKVLVDLLNKLDTSKYDITLFTLFEEGVNRKNLHPQIRQRWFFSRVFRGYSVIQRFIPARWLYALFIREKYDVVIAYLEGVATRIVSGCTEKKTRKIAWVHTKIDDIGIDQVHNGKEGMRACYLTFDRIICVSELGKITMQSYLGIPDEKLQVIHNALDVQSVLEKSKASLPEEFDPNTINLVSVGRLNPQKGFDRLLEVCRRLKEDGFSFCLRLVGAGEQEARFRDYIEKNDLKNNIKLIGFQSNPYPWVKHSNIFVCSSRVEGFSTAVSEAIILEVPVITTDCSGMDEILENGKYGEIVGNDTESLYVGLKNMLAHPAEIARWKSMAMARSQYFISANHVKEVEQLFDN